MTKKTVRVWICIGGKGKTLMKKRRRMSMTMNLARVMMIDNEEFIL
jgi:hypothetical protein